MGGREKDMRNSIKNSIIVFLLAAFFCALFSSCGGGPVTERSGSAYAAGALDTKSMPAASAAGAAAAPAFVDSPFSADKASKKGDVMIDASSVSSGYVGVSAKSTKRLKFQVVKDGKNYNYDIKSDGTVSIFPLQMGDGSYKFRVMQNIEGSKYAELYSVTQDVKMKDSFQPFIRPSDYSKYTKDSECVKKSAELAKNCKSKIDIIGNVYKYVSTNIKYDYDKAATVKSGYMPLPDATLKDKKGICFDYASLAAAMLRSQGIPVKLVFGYVQGTYYHAWNVFYTEETGWVTVSFKTDPNQWHRLDLTFISTGSTDGFVAKDTNYSDVYYY